MSTQASNTAPTPESLEFISTLAQDALAEIRAACRLTLHAMSGTPRPIDQDDLRMLLQMVVTRAELTIAHISDTHVAGSGELSRRPSGGGGGGNELSDQHQPSDIP